LALECASEIEANTTNKSIPINLSIMKKHHTSVRDRWINHFGRWLVVFGLLVVCWSSEAADVIKADNADNLNLGSSWSGGVPPTSADVAVWDATVTIANPVNLGANTNWAGIRILNPGGAVNITNTTTTLTLGASGIDTSGASQPLVLACPVVVGAAQDWNLVTSVTVSGGISGNNNVNLLAGTVIIAGSGTTLSNIVVNSGATVQANAGGVGVIALNGGTFTVNAAVNENLNVLAGGGTEQNTGGNRTWSGSLFGSGPLTVIASSTHTWNGNHSGYNGTITLQGTGALRLSSVNSVNAATTYIFNGGTMNPNATGTFNLGSLAGASGFLNPSTAGPFSIGALNTDTTFGGVIGGAGNLIKIGTGTLTLSGANTFSGALIISNGVVQIDDGSGVGKLGTGNVTNYSRLVLNRAGTLVMPNLITGPGPLTNMGFGKVTLTGANNYSGETFVTAGTLAFGSASQLTNTISVSDGATIGATPTSASATVTHGNVNLGTGAGCSYEFDFSTLANPTSTVVSNTGTITLNGNVTVNVLGTNTALTVGNITLLRYTSRSGGGSFVLGSLPMNVTANLTDDTANKRVVLNITSVGGFVDPTFRWVGDTAGIWDVDNLANQIWKVVGTGQTTNYTEGAAVLFDDTATGTTNIDLIAFVNPGAVTVNNTNKTYTLGGIGAISGATGLVKKGPGTLIVTNANSYAGLTEIQAGTIRVEGETGAIGSGGVTNNGGLILDRTQATNALPNTMSFFGQITGTGALTILGVDSTNSTVEVEVGVTAGNPYSGGTTISNTFVRLNANPISDGTRSAAKSTGLGTGQITFLGDSVLELEDYGVGNNSAQAGDFVAPLNLPAGQVGTLRTGGRMTVSGALTGSGTFNLAVSYIRCIISGDYSAFTGQVNVTPSPNTTGNQYQIGNAAGLPAAKVHLAAGVTMGGNNPLPNNSIVPIGELSADEGSFIGAVGEAPRNAIFSIGGLNTSSTFAGSIAAHSLTKVGAGTLTLSGTNNTYAGATVISNGVLALVTNSLGGNTEISNTASITIAAPGVLDVSGQLDGTFALGAGGAAQTLNGNGTIRGSLNVGSLGTVTPGFSVGTLTVTNAVTLGGAVTMELNRASASNSDRIVAPTVTAGGALTVTNIGAALQVGDTFQLFSTAVSGSFVTVNLPTNDSVNNVAYTWNNKLAVDGTIVVLTATPTVNTTPTNITFTATGNTLDLQWPADHTGWTLQTNSVGVAVANAWFPHPGSTSTNRVILTIDPTKTNVFYRLVYP
jgi:fibronectin-binding autotransporter adhesin